MIAREVFVRAFRHSRAKSILVNVEYKANRLRVIFRDDGDGVVPPAPGSQNHARRWFEGMQDRVEKIGGRLKVRSRTGAGTEVALSVPGSVAFQSPSAQSSPKWHARWYLPKRLTRQ